MITMMKMTMTKSAMIMPTMVAFDSNIHCGCVSSYGADGCNEFDCDNDDDE